MNNLRAGFALCGSFCTFDEVIPQIKKLAEEGADVLPIMSETAAATDTRFGRATDHIKKIEEICGNTVIRTIAGAEPIGPGKKLDILIIAPCTGNTLSKLASGITDSAVTMAAKAVFPQRQLFTVKPLITIYQYFHRPIKFYLLFVLVCRAVQKSFSLQSRNLLKSARFLFLRWNL